VDKSQGTIKNARNIPATMTSMSRPRAQGIGTVCHDGSGVTAKTIAPGCVSVTCARRRLVCLELEPGVREANSVELAAVAPRPLKHSLLAERFLPFRLVLKSCPFAIQGSVAEFA
jgi:hypothetical protein